MHAQNIPSQRGFPPVVIHFTDAAGEEFGANTDSDSYKKLVLMAGQTSQQEHIINMIKDGQPVDALKQLTKVLDKINDKTFHPTMTLAIHALRLLEEAGDKAVASVLR